MRLRSEVIPCEAFTYLKEIPLALSMAGRL